MEVEATKNGGKPGMLGFPFKQQNWGIFLRVIFVELLLFQYGSTARHRYSGTKHHTMRRNCVLVTVPTVPNLVKHHLQKFFCTLQSMIFRCLFMDLVKLNWMFCFLKWSSTNLYHYLQSLGSTSCILICHIGLQLALLQQICWSWFGHSHVALLFVLTQSCGTTHNANVAKDGSCQGYRWMMKWLALQYWLDIQFNGQWLGVGGEMKPWMKQ